jgi:hypothetical protein
MNTSHKDQQLDFKPVRCSKCNGILFDITPTQETFFIRVKCRRCTLKRRMKTKRRQINVFVVVKISLEPPEETVLDSNSESSARAA